jgi:hypothetical protein
MNNAKPWCCLVTCNEDAEFEIWGESGQYHDNTQACRTHVGDLLGSPEGIDNKSWSISAIQEED